MQRLCWTFERHRARKPDGQNGTLTGAVLVGCPVCSSPRDTWPSPRFSLARGAGAGSCSQFHAHAFTRSGRCPEHRRPGQRGTPHSRPGVRAPVLGAGLVAPPPVDPVVPLRLTAARWSTGSAELGGRRRRTRLRPGVLRSRSQVPVGGHRHQAGRGAGEAAPEGGLEVRRCHSRPRGFRRRWLGLRARPRSRPVSECAETRVLRRGERPAVRGRGRGGTPRGCAFTCPPPRPLTAPAAPT